MFVRSQQVRIGAPLSFDEQHPLPTSLELLLGALGSDVAVSLIALANKKRVEIDNVEVVVEGSIDNPLVWLGVIGEEGTTALQHASVKVYVGTFETAERINPVWTEAVSRSPLVSTLQRALELDLQMVIV